MSALIWTVVLFSCLGHGWAAPAEETSSLEIKMASIMDRMSKMEADMESKDRRISDLESSRTEMMSDIESKDLKISAMKEVMEAKDLQMSEVKEELVRLRDSPYSYQCGWREEWSVDNTNITYERLLYSSNSGVEGGLDITTGQASVHDILMDWSIKGGRMGRSNINGPIEN